MKRIAFALAVILSGLLLGAHAQASVNDFSFTDFHADYYLNRDSSGHSTLRTVEQLSALFPDYDQNHGIERAIPYKYDGHKTGLNIQSVTKPDGSAWPFTTYRSGDFTVVRIGSADTYVHGPQIYKLTYTQQDVTKYFASTNDDEFYWDTNGTGWSQSFSAVSASVHVPKTLSSALNGKQACYQGYQGGDESCDITKDTAADGSVVFQVAATRTLYPGENVTFAIGFAPNTFAKYTPSIVDRILSVLILVFVLSIFITGPIGVVLLIWFTIRRSRKKYRKSELGTIVPEYLPPKDTSVLVASKVLSELKGGVQSAQIIDLAVRHYLKIYQTTEKGLFRAAQYELEIVKPLDDLLPEERKLLETLFGGETRFAMKKLKNNTGLYIALASQDRRLTKSLVREQYEIYEYDERGSKWFRRVGVGTLVFSILTLSPLCFVAAVMAFIYAHKATRLSDKGLALERYLYGLRDYIKLAEAERLRALQSPEGAEKVGEAVDGANTAQLIKLYERVLPYAVLFGQEKEWNKVLGQYYQSTNTQPNWYSGSNMFSAASFTAAMSSFSSAASYSSSSGGSGGGGSSGGGGGGGGGGGW